MREVRLLTLLTEFDRLHLLAGTKARSVRVDCDALTHLLVDHSALVSACKGAAIKVIEPVPARQRARLAAGKPLRAP